MVRQTSVYFKETGLNAQNPLSKREKARFLVTPARDSQVALPPTLRKKFSIRQKLYPRRWFIMIIVALLIFSNMTIWIAHAPVANYVDEYYHKDGASAWLSGIFLFMALPFCVIAMWTTTKFGLRFAILIAACFNCIGGGMKLMACMPGFPLTLKFPIVMVGQEIAALAGPFTMLLPTKVSATWFSASEAPIATTIMAMSNPLAVLFSNLFSPMVVTSVNEVAVIMVYTFGISGGVTLLAFFVVTQSEPHIPPTAAAQLVLMPFFKGIKTCLTNKSFMVLCLALGAGMGAFNGLYALMQQILCTKGYSNNFVGFGLALMIIGGIIGALLVGVFVSKTKMYVETVKVSFAFTILLFIAFILLQMNPDMKAWIAATLFILGAFGFAAYPIGLELAAECTFPADASTSNALIAMGGRIQGAVMILLLKSLSFKLEAKNSHREVCTLKNTGGEIIQPRNSVPALLTIAGYGTLCLILLVVFLRPKLHRLEKEKETKEDEKCKQEEQGETETDL